MSSFLMPLPKTRNSITVTFKNGDEQNFPPEANPTWEVVGSSMLVIMLGGGTLLAWPVADIREMTCVATPKEDVA